MFRIWGKVYQGDHIEKQTVYAREERFTYSEFFRYLADICDELAGMYPKDFKFVGWHPSCRCYSVKVLKTMDEFLEDEQKLLNGEALTADSANTVRDMPPQFRQWVLDNRDRIAKARAKGTESYFLRDNKAYVDGILDPKPNALKIAQKRHSKGQKRKYATSSGGGLSAMRK